MTRRMWRSHQRLLKHLENDGGVRRVVFLCNGNICRSPLAAALAQAIFPEVEMISAGFHPQPGRSCPEKILETGLEFGVDLSRHRSLRLSEQVLRETSLILAMDFENVTRLEREMPEFVSRTTLLGLFARPRTSEIHDPYASGLEETRRICQAVRSSVDGLASFLRRIPPAVESKSQSRDHVRLASLRQ